VFIIIIIFYTFGYTALDSVRRVQSKQLNTFKIFIFDAYGFRFSPVTTFRIEFILLRYYTSDNK